jgi:hypothetical protein
MAIPEGVAVNEARYYACDFGDASARLFWVENRLHCGLTPSRALVFRNARETGLFDDLVRREYILPVKPIVSTDEDFAIVLELELMPRVSYCYEWCPPMWKAATLHLLDLLLVLSCGGLTLEEPNPWNLLFNGPKPVYIHPGSLVPFSIETARRGFEKVCRFFLRPLLLSDAGLGHVARRLQHDVHEGVAPGDTLSGNPAWLAWRADTQEDFERFLSRVRTQVDQIEAKGRTTKFSDYYVDGAYVAPTLTYKTRVMERLLDELRPSSVVDVGSNTGRYSRLASHRGCDVIAMDFDESCICRLFETVRQAGETLLSLVMDFTNPSPGYGICNDWFPPATSRLRGDLVLGLALEHHLVFGRHRLTFDQIARGFASFCDRSLLVEFVPPGVDTNANPLEWRPESESWYKLECFAAAFEKKFESVNPLPPDPESPRRLLLCQRPRA